MLTGILDNIKRERATFARDIAYIQEMAFEDRIEDCVTRAESLYIKENSEDIKEAFELLERVDETDFDAMESEEIERIMESTEDMTFDEMIGIE